MRVTTTILSFFLVLIWTISSLGADEKNKVKEKNFWIQKTENKAGLGVMVSNVDNDDPDSKKEGAEIVEVFKNSEAERIGLKKGDIILEVYGKSITKPSDLIDIFDDVEEGTEVKLTVLRENTRKSFTANLKPFEGHAYAYRVDDDDDILVDVFKTTEPDKNFSIIPSTGINATAGGKGGYLGVQVKDLSDQLKEYFEVDNGVLIEEVMKDSPAEKAGLKAGDVIVSIGNRKIEDYQDLIRTVNYYNPEEEVSLSYVRKGDTEKSMVILGKKPSYQRIKNKMKRHKSLRFIDEDQEHNLLITGEGDGNVIWNVEEDPHSNIEIEKEFIIL
jgi:S1-C subfamily serine protease